MKEKEKNVYDMLDEGARRQTDRAVLS